MTNTEILQQRLAEITPLSEITPEQAQEAIIAFLNFLEERIDNEKIDDFLNKLEENIAEDRFGLFRSVFSAVKGWLLSRKL